MSDVVRSIFRQRQVEKLYELCFSVPFGFSSYHSKDVRLKAIKNTDNVIADKEIGRYDIEIPMLEIGEEFFLHDIQKPVKIKSKMRSSDNSITYYVEDEVVETENTKKSYEECREKFEHWKCSKEEFDALKKEFNKYKSKYKYEHRFFNKKITEQ